MTANVKNVKINYHLFPAALLLRPLLLLLRPLATCLGRLCRTVQNDNKLLFLWLYFHKLNPGTTRGQITCSESRRAEGIVLWLGQRICNNLSSETDQKVIFLPLFGRICAKYSAAKDAAEETVMAVAPNRTEYDSTMNRFLFEWILPGAISLAISCSCCRFV